MPAGIHLYRPQRTKPEDLEAIFVARQPLVEEILARLERWRPQESRQHYLLIGPRGIGKTCLLQIVRRRILQDARLRNKWHPIALAEEGYSLLRVSDVLVEALRLLGQETGDAAVLQTYERVRRDSDHRRVTDLALDGFRRFHQATGRGIVLMVENVNRILDRQLRRREENHLLRKTLIEEDWLVAICTSPTYVNAVISPDEPFFEFFQVKRLGELTLAQQEEMLRKLAALENGRELEEYLARFRSRLAALYHFTGGNPRLALMLYDLIVHQRVTDVHEELDALLDQLTPFYQDRMGDLGEQEGMLLEAMSLLPEGASPTELAAEVRLEPQSVRALLQRLEQAGYVRREERRQKRTVYTMPERFFRIWHQMNHSPAARGRVQYLLEFFSTWYATRKERDEIWDELLTDLEECLSIGDQGRVADVTSYMSYVAAAADGTEKYAREFEPLRMLAARNGPDSVLDRLGELDREYGQDADYWMHKGCFFAEVTLDDVAALDAFTMATQIAPDHLAATFNRALALDRLGRDADADAAYRHSVVLLATEASVTHVKDACGILLDALRNAKSMQATWYAGRLLGRLGGRELMSQVVEILAVADQPWHRRHCINVLGMFGGVGAAEAVLPYLNDSADEVRGAAATALGKLGSAQAVGPLIDRLRDEASNVRGSAATALGKLASAQAVGPLIDCLRDEASNVRGSAATALGRLGSAQAVGPLIECLRDSANDVRGSVATALGKLGSVEAVCPLIECLRDPASDVRGSSAAALGRIGDPRAVDALVACLADLAADVYVSTATAFTRIAEKQVAEHLGDVYPVIVGKLPVRRRLPSVFSSVLAAAFRSQDLNVVRGAIRAIESRWQDGAALYAPHAIALNFLESGRSPEILERQQPEMREAVEMLVRAFDGQELPGGGLEGATPA